MLDDNTYVGACGCCDEVHTSIRDQGRIDILGRRHLEPDVAIDRFRAQQGSRSANHAL